MIKFFKILIIFYFRFILCLQGELYTVKYGVMLKILMLLLQRRKITASELAERYEVSVRSIYRYIEELIICGVPIDIQRGRYGGITVSDTFRLPTGYFTKEEYSATINALDAMSSQIYDENLISAREKLASRQKSEKRELSVCGNIIVDGGTWGDSKKFTEKMKVCEQAVNENACIKIDYISRGGEHSKRVIEPHVLIFKQNVWYVWAFCHNKQQFRTFKIGRIKSAVFTGKNFKKKEFTRKDIDLNFIYKEEDLINVTFDIDKTSLADAEEWLGIDNIEPKGNGFTANMLLPDDSLLINKILSYGGTIKVACPEELKLKVKEAAEKIARSL